MYWHCCVMLDQFPNATVYFILDHLESMSCALQEFWLHCKKFEWTTECMFQHCYRLADSLASSKECVEDLFGAGVDLQRTNKNPWKTGTVEKLHHLQSHWIRLDRDQWPKVRLRQHDFAETHNTALRRHCNIGSFAPESTLSTTFRLATLKQRAGHVCFKEREVFWLLFL